jgi:AraC family transcriptional regulator, L-rhamnose operon transcriptional activator RhaR
MKRLIAHPTTPPELSWLLEVTESRQPLSDNSPIWVRHGVVREGPPTPHPERHPYCEIGIVLEGKGISLVGREEAWRLPGDLLLLGPGVPHWGRIKLFPLRYITVYFLPAVVIEMDPVKDGFRILRRFTAKQSLATRLIRPSRQLLARVVTLFQELVSESEQERCGREVLLRTLLMEILVLLLRWEESKGIAIGSETSDVDWRPVQKTLAYLRENYTEPIYAKDVARAAGLSESRLKVLFQEALGLSWVKYLQGYRIHRAAAALSESTHNVTEAALAVGFDSLSHFNATFRSFMGISPKRYAEGSYAAKVAGG